MSRELDWQDKAACKGTDVELFFLPHNSRGDDKRRRLAAAKAICSGCVVRAECLEYAVRTEQPFGVWGGLSEEERQRLSRRKIVSAS